MELKNRQKTINSIIKFYSQILIENTDFNIDLLNDTIYKNLVRWYDTLEEQVHDNSDNFNTWIEYFDNKENIEIFIDKTWKYFIQLQNNKREALKEDNSIKLYIPLNSETIKDGVISLFDYIREQNIPFVAKIGKHTRFDNIVIRVKDIESAKKIIEYVDKNEFIKEGMLPPNPFTYNEKNIALAVDGKLSYTGIISDYIAIYLKELKENNQLETADYEEFAIFVYEYHKKTFIEKIDTNRIYKDFNLEEYSIAYIANNIKQITDLFIKSLNPEFTIEDFNNHYLECNNKKQNEIDSKEYFYTLIKDKLDIEDIDDILDYTINTLLPTSTRDEIFIRLQMYLEDGNPMNITRVSGIREYLINNKFREKMLEKLELDGITFDEYYNKKFDEDDEEIVEQIEEVEEPVIEETEEIDILKTEEILLENNIIEEVIDPKEEYLKEAIKITYNKYETKYQNKEYSRTGKEHIYLALLQLIKKQNYDGFTIENNARQNLKDNILPEEIEDIIKKAIKNTDDLNTLIYDFIDYTINNEVKIKELTK